MGSVQHGLKTELFSVDHEVYIYTAIPVGVRERRQEGEDTREREDKTRETEARIKSFSAEDCFQHCLK